MLRSLIASAVLALLVLAASQVSASPTATSQEVVTAPMTPMTRAAERQAIRQMPLLMRPNRPGHFYGNTVRRLYYGR